MTVASARHVVSIPTGGMEVFTAWPQAAQGALPAVVVLMDMWGLRETVREVARQVAAMGYYALLPDLYQRTDSVRLDALPGSENFRKYTDIPTEIQKRLRAAMDRLRDDDVVEDVAAVLQAARNWEMPLASRVGLVGYCMGGRHALCLAGAMNDRVRAAACLHGTALIQDEAGEKSPHRRALKAQGELYFGHAELDEYASRDVPDRLAASLAAGSAAVQQAVHAGTRHGYALNDRAIHDPEATARDWAAIEAMFQRQLKAA